MRSIRNILFWLVAIPLACASACATPTPTPDPGPRPTDAAAPYPFDGLVADCAADSAQSPSVLSPVNSCLAGSNPVDGCMVDLMTTWPADAIACGVRAIGTSAAISRASGDAGAAPRAAAVEARTWLLIHNVQFRN